ncbi:two-component system sensor histidine kinase YesM [Breznakia blatticola]|uniref:histidine kinase n=1 Tax=Breznakia blatticola TaxID=1754012 RepID=A0A4R8A882_9FIRM|nr:sensor histidine kinase [Breznakia blatticola]TDW26091.1 two-component system sensor histidine kinase YesM [Breznakia blatticola]
MKWRRRKWQGITLQLIIAFVMIALSLSIIISLSVFFLNGHIENIEESALRNSQQVVLQAANSIDDLKAQMETRVKKVKNEVQHMQSVEEIQAYLNVFTDLEDDVEGVFLYDSTGSVLLYGNNGRNLKSNMVENLSFDDVLFLNNQHTISTMRPHVESIFENYYPWVVTMGVGVDTQVLDDAQYLVIDYKFSGISSYVDNIGIGQRGYCFVIDNNNNIVYHPKQRMINSGVVKENISTISKLKGKEEIVDGAIYVKKSIDNGQWSIVGVSYVNELIADQVKEFQVYVAAISCIFIIISILLSMFVATKVSKPIKRLVGAMNEFENNVDSYVYEPQGGVFEIKRLSFSFSKMVVIIRNLIKKAKDEEITLRKTEMKALESQINPHFLYNTLDSIQWMCEQGKMDEAVEMVGALAKLFRISINKGRQLIPIREEIEHAIHYLTIQKYRYRDQFTYDFDVDERALKYYTNKITIQPILENAIYHGIDRMIDEGHIQVNVRLVDQIIHMEIIDNGLGMTEEQIVSILSKDQHGKNGIGLKNVNDRIKIYFGDAYGVKVESELDEGTKVTITFPAVLGEEDDLFEN